MSSRRLRRAAVASACLTLAGAIPAAAATKNGITPTAPKPGATIPVGQAPTFKGRVRGGGDVFVHVCKSARRNRKGVICGGAMVKRARKSGSRFSVKADFFDFREFWLNSPGTYYWQAYRIRCERGNLKDCLQEGPVVRIKVA